MNECVARDDPGVYYCLWGLQALHSSRQTGTLLVVSSLINHSHVEGKGGLGMFVLKKEMHTNTRAVVFVCVIKAGNPTDLSACLPARDSSAASQTFGRQLSLERSERQVACSLTPFRGSGEIWLLISQQPRFDSIMEAWIHSAQNSRNLARDFQKSCFYCDETTPVDFSKP